MQKQNPLLILLILTASLALSACANQGQYQRRTTNQNATTAQQTVGQTQTLSPTNIPDQNLPPIKIAILLPLSGPNAALGDAMLKSAQMALFDVGHTNMELIPRDTKGTPEGASAAASSAVNAGAQMILGPLFAGSVRAAKPIAENARINMIAFSTDWKLAGGNTYIMGFLPFDQIERITAFSAQRGIKSVAMLAPASDYGIAVSGSFNANAPRNGLRIVANQSFDPNTSNLSTTVKNFTAAANGAQAVLIPVGGQQARDISNLLTLNGMPPTSIRRLGTGLMDDDALATERNLDGTWFAAPAPQSRRAFEQRYASTYGEKAPRLASLAFDATALAAVLARQGYQNGGRAAFDRNAIMNPNGFSGLDGIFRFRSNNTAERGLSVLEYKNNQITVIDPAPTAFNTATN